MTKLPDGRWTMDKHIPVALVLALFLQAMAVVWWASNIAAKQDYLDAKLIDNNAIQVTILARLLLVESAVPELQKTITRLDNHLSRMKASASGRPPRELEE